MPKGNGKEILFLEFAKPSRSKKVGYVIRRLKTWTASKGNALKCYSRKQFPHTSQQRDFSLKTQIQAIKET